MPKKAPFGAFFLSTKLDSATPKNAELRQISRLARALHVFQQIFEVWVSIPDLSAPQTGLERATAKEEIMKKAENIFLWITVGFFVVLYMAVTIPVYG